MPLNGSHHVEFLSGLKLYICAPNWNLDSSLEIMFFSMYFMVALHFSSNKANFANICMDGNVLYFLFLKSYWAYKCAAIWNQFIKENQLRVESHWNERWAMSGGCAWSTDASFGSEDEETNQDDRTQCLRMSFAPVEAWARVVSKRDCRSWVLLFTDGMDTRGLDTCLQQVFPMGWDA